MPINLPNILTLLRIALIPVFVVVFYLPFAWAPPASALTFALAGVTDWFDGWLARRWHETSAFGAFLDPVADKLMVIAALVLILQHDPHTIMAIPIMIIIGRELTISALREWMAELGARKRVAVSWLGKVKTAVQMTSIVLLLYRHTIGAVPIYTIGVGLLLVAAALTLASMCVYLVAAWPELRRERRTP
ncbi:MAG: CDP-diacylglycerol--glycerol-3-phosphate 3-phosphatidyltransferase [Gammaproteobacteria bacterium]